MRLNVRSFCFASVVVATIPALILFIWCSLTGFGMELVRIFESVHPSGSFSIVAAMHASFIGCIPGIVINTIYTAVDAFILSFMFVMAYNFFVVKFEK